MNKEGAISNCPGWGECSCMENVYYATLERRPGDAQGKRLGQRMDEMAGG